MNSVKYFAGVAIIAIAIIVSSFIIREGSAEEKWQKYVMDNYKIFPAAISDSINFCNEKVPIKRFDVYEALDNELLKTVYWQSNTFLTLKKANRWFPIIEPILKKYNIPNDFKYIAVIESNFAHVVSPVGASGFWQFMKATAQEYNLEVNDEVDERYNITLATEAACKYFLDSYARLNNWTLVAASYNMGVAGLAKRVEQQNSKSFYDLSLNTETSRYIYRLLAVKLIVENPKSYGYNLRVKDLYPEIPVNTVVVDTSINDLKEFAQLNNITYKTLKYFNPWLKDTKLTNIKRKKYLIEIPTTGFYNFFTLFPQSSEVDVLIKTTIPKTGVLDSISNR